MSSVLAPELALAYLRELSPDITRCALLDGEGGLLAGDAGLASFAEPAGPSPVWGADPSAVAAAPPVLVRDGEGALVALAAGRAPRELVELDARLAFAAVRGRC
jgi:hypothetical protein